MNFLFALILTLTPALFPAVAQAEALAFEAGFHRLGSIDEFHALKARVEAEGCEVLEKSLLNGFESKPSLAWLTTMPKGTRSILYRMDPSKSWELPFFVTLPASFVEYSLFCAPGVGTDQKPTIDVFDGRDIMGSSAKPGLPASYAMHRVSAPTQVYVLVFSQTGPVFPLLTLSSDAHEQAIRFDKILFFFIIGSIFAIFVYNLFLFLGAKKAAYKYNVFYILWAVLLNYFQGWGYLMTLRWSHPNFEQTYVQLYNACFTAAIILGSSSAILFLVAFAETKERSPRMHQGLFVTIAGGFILGLIVIITILAGMDRVVWLRATRLFPIFAMTVVFLSSGYLAIRKKELLGWLFFVPITFLVVGTIITMLGVLGFLEMTPLVRYSFAAGTLTESLLLSLSVGIKVRKSEKEAANQIKEYNEKLQTMNEGLEKQVELRTRDIRSIMSTIKQGILMLEVNDDRVFIGDEVSRFSQHILGFDPRGKSLKESILMPSNLQPDNIEAAETALSSTIGEDSTFMESNLHLLPSELLYFRNQPGLDKKDERLLELDWSFVEVNQSVQKSILTVRDVTEEKKTKLRLQESEGELSIVMAAVQRGEKATCTILHDVQELARKAHEALAALPKDEAYTHVKRHIHTAKGLLRAGGQSFLSSRLHEIESRLFAERDQLFPLVDMFQGIPTKGLSALQHYLGWKFEGGAEIELTTSLLNILQNPLRGMTEAVHALGKKEPRIQLQGPAHESIFSRPMAQALVEVFTHTLRNAVDHGLEQNSQGTIGIFLDQHGDGWKLILKDDGRGLNLNRLRSQARFHGQARGTDNEVADLIFQADVSTRDQVTEISGRGVGLYAARAALREQNADIQVEFTGAADAEGYRPFQFVIGYGSRSREQAVG